MTKKQQNRYPRKSYSEDTYNQRLQSLRSPVYVLAPEEIEPGLVLFLNPITYKQNGGISTIITESFENGKARAHLCIRVEPSGRSVWIPLFSKPGPGRFLLTTEGREGHPTWTNGTYYKHRIQEWELSFEAVRKSAQSGQDHSKPGMRNYQRVILWERTPETDL